MSDTPPSPAPPAAPAGGAAAVLARLVAAQATSKAAQERYQALHRLLLELLAARVRVAQDERKALDAGQLGQAVADQLVQQLGLVARQLVEAIQAEYANLAALLNGAAAPSPPPPAPAPSPAAEQPPATP